MLTGSGLKDMDVFNQYHFNVVQSNTNSVEENVRKILQKYFHS